MEKFKEKCSHDQKEQWKLTKDTIPLPPKPKAKKQVVNLIYWKTPIGAGNFGDEISKVVMSSLINRTKYELVFNQPNIKINLVGIGSYMQAAKEDSFIFGTGIRTQPIKKFKNLNICAVRGPLTKKHMKHTNNHIKVPNIFGDPALLLPKFYKPVFQETLKEKIGIIPHISNYKKYKTKTIDSKYYLINPTDKWQTIINYIYSCKYIMSSSLHGLICSDAYNKPNIWLDEFKLAEGHFKFKDYFQSQNRKIISIKQINQFDENLLYCKGNTIDLEILLQQFPFK